MLLADGRPLQPAPNGFLADPRLLLWLAPSVLSTQQRFLRRGGDPDRTQLHDSGDEFYGNRFGEWELDRPHSQLISAELIPIFERREERRRCGK